MTTRNLRILKLGGSLLDWPPCAEVLRSWVADQPPMLNVVIVGGGPTVDAVRQRSCQLTCEAAHWESIRCMEANARRFADDELPMVEAVHAPIEAVPQNAIAVLAVMETHLRGSSLPLSWSVTSDSIAAWFVMEHAAAELVLLKSCHGSGRTARELSAAGVVDEYFPAIAEQIEFRVVNLRQVPHQVQDEAC